MSENINAKLWFSTTDDGFFLIPESVTLEEGDFELCNYFGHKRHVDSENAKTYSVTRESAMAYIRIQVESFFSNLSDRISNSLQELDWNNAAERIADIIAPMFSTNEKTDEAPEATEVGIDDKDDISMIH